MALSIGAPSYLEHDVVTEDRPHSPATPPRGSRHKALPSPCPRSGQGFSSRVLARGGEPRPRPQEGSDTRRCRHHVHEADKDFHPECWRGGGEPRRCPQEGNYTYRHLRHQRRGAKLSLSPTRAPRRRDSSHQIHHDTGPTTTNRRLQIKIRAAPPHKTTHRQDNPPLLPSLHTPPRKALNTTAATLAGEPTAQTTPPGAATPASIDRCPAPPPVLIIADSRRKVARCIPGSQPMRGREAAASHLPRPPTPEAPPEGQRAREPSTARA